MIPNDAEVLAAVHGLVAPHVLAAEQRGGLPPVRSDDWLNAPPAVQLAALLVLAEAWLVANPEQVIRSRLRAASDDISGAADWPYLISGGTTTRAPGGEPAHLPYPGHVPHDEIRRRRGQPGPLARRSA